MSLPGAAPASAVPVITVRLTHYWWNGGRSLAMCEKTADLRKDTASFVKKGDVYEVTFDFDIGLLQGLVHMRDGLVGRTAVAVGRYGLTLDLMEMKSGSPKVRIGSVEAW